MKKGEEAMKKLTLVLLAFVLLLMLAGCACKHEETELTGVIGATCTQAGYTGDTVCLKCKEIVTKGEEIAAKGHAEGEAQGVVNADCENEGYTGDVYCLNCDELLTKGEKIAKTEHIPGDTNNAKEATCERDGYSGDVYCLACRAMLKEGEVIPATGHMPGEVTGAAEPTCSAAGYTGDAYCTVCEDLLKGEVIPKLEHPYENGVCPTCGWRESGLYIGDEMIYTWQELVDNGMVKLVEKKDGTFRLDDVQKLSGQLVIDESVTGIRNKAMNRTTLMSIWIPVTCMEIDNNTMSGSDTLEEVVIFAPIEVLPAVSFQLNSALKRVVLPDTLKEIGDYAFERSKGIEEIVIPEGVVKLGTQAFEQCEALRSVTLPSTLEWIGGSAFAGCKALNGLVLPENVKYIGNEIFRGCESLTEINLPEGLEEIGENAFRDTAITHLTIPSTVTRMREQSWLESLISVDMSKAALTELQFAQFTGCSALEELILPEKLISLECYAIKSCKSLRKLVLPERLMTMENGDELKEDVSLTSIVWPVTLLDGEALSYLPNLTEIYYRGSEKQWQATSSKDLFPNATITFDYTGE